jgi:competence protein ComEA
MPSLHVFARFVLASAFFVSLGAWAESPATTNPAAVATATPTADAAADSKAPSTATTAATGLTSVSINTADAATLAKYLIGVGPTKAEAIVAYRTQHGRFTSAEQLLEVKGIGAATFNKNKHLISL